MSCRSASTLTEVFGWMWPLPQLAQVARGRLRRSLPELQLALDSRVSDHPRYLLQHLLAPKRFIDQQPAQLRRFSPRIGRKRSLIAVAHTILTIAYHLLHRKPTYQDLGPDYFERSHAESLQKSLVRRLERLGNIVILQPTQAQA